MTRRNFRTDALARFLALRPMTIVMPADTFSMTDAEKVEETARLDALSLDQQLLIACAAMGWSVIEYLEQRSALHGDMMNEREWLELPHEG